MVPLKVTESQVNNKKAFRIHGRSFPVKSRSVASVLLMGLLTCGSAWARDVALVSNKANTMNGIALADLVKACKGETTHWQDGKPVVVIMRRPAMAEMKLVVDKVYGVSEGEVTQIIAAANRSRGNHPAVVFADNDQDVLNQVSNTPGAVGFVDVYSINSSVEVLKVGGHLPLEPGYVLHGN